MLSFIIAASALVVLGCIDDYRNLGWKIKLLATLISISIIVFMGGVTIRDLGLYGMNRRATLDILSIPFTYLCIIGVTNAINLIDGLNGLAGGIAMIAFFFLGIGGFMAGEQTLTFICFAFTGALLGFLFYNFPRARIFMGDSGSLPLGFSLAVLSILLTQGNSPLYPLQPILTEADLFLAALSENPVLQPMFPVLVLILPIFDTVRVMSVRMFQRKNPFHADKTHLHHLFIRKGYSPVITVIIFWALSCLYGLLAVALMRRSATPYLFVVLIICLIMSLFAESMSRRKRVNRENDIGGV
jgi:UDP-GlcNAc:undecaprenyl-phosphate GlcNAc-1-phosphate transferase